MAIQPSLRPLVVAGHPDAPHTLDVFLDFVCPYSAKMARTIDTVLKGVCEPGGQYAGKVKVIFRLQVQPWHSASTLTHEAGLAALHASPNHFWPFSLALFNHQEEYYDKPTLTMTPEQIREKLSALAKTVLPASSMDKFDALLKLKDSPNGGVGVTNDLKYNIKFARQNSIHVSPTAMWDGLVANEVSSSWSELEWKNFLSDRVRV